MEDKLSELELSLQQLEKSNKKQDRNLRKFKKYMETQRKFLILSLASTTIAVSLFVYSRDKDASPEFEKTIENLVIVLTTAAGGTASTLLLTSANRAEDEDEDEDEE